jgi:hypothetical protein
MDRLRLVAWLDVGSRLDPLRTITHTKKVTIARLSDNKMISSNRVALRAHPSVEPSILNHGQRQRILSAHPRWNSAES